MKKNKNNKNNKSKLLLASLCIPVIVSTLPIENVFADENEIPKMNVYINDSGIPKLEWATEILKENILVQSSFEENDMIPTIFYNNSTGQQSFTNEDFSSGNIALKIGKTYGSLGNNYSYPGTSSNSSRAIFNERFYIPNGINLSVSMKVKTDESIKIDPLGAGGTADRQMTFQEYFKSATPITFTQDTIPGQSYFYVNNPSNFKKLIGSRVLYTVDRKATNGAYSYLEILNIDEKTGKVTLKNPFKEVFKAGEDVLVHRSTTPVSFPGRTIQDTGGEWVTVNFNSSVSKDIEEFNTLTRGILFRIVSASYGNSYIDDVTFGYATQVEVFRDDVSIYKGYLADFEDKEMKDKLKPNKVNKINTSILDNFKVQFNPIKPQDQSKEVIYTIQSVAQNGSRSEMSKPHKIETSTGVQKYKYTINKSNTSPTSLTSSTNGLNFDIALSTLNIEKDYLHIQSVDGVGNLSEIQTFKIQDIIDTSSLQSLYDKLKQVENNMDFNDFIDFIDDVENLYGTNIPQDIKDRIQELSSYHGANTTFLQLLEGDFRLMIKDINSFGQTKLTAKKQILTTDFLGDFNVVDARGTQEGWKINVSATPFIEDEFEGFIGKAVELPIGTLSINTVKDIEQIGKVHESKLPIIYTTSQTIIDNGEVTLISANKGYGMGEFAFNFNENALSMVVDAVTAKIDTVNYPDGITPYTSTITWNLITGP